MTRAPLAAELHALPYGPERSRAVYDLFMAGRTKAECARLTGLTPGQVGAAIRWCYRQGLPRKGRPAPRLRQGARLEQRGARATAESVSGRITTLEQLLAACQVDLARWEVERHVINKYEVAAKTAGGELAVEQVFQVKAWLRARRSASVEEALEHTIARLADVAPHLPAPRPPRVRGQYLVVPGLYDAHINKRSADGAYTIERAVADFCAVVDAAAARIRALGMPVERVMLPAGNDALHADNLAGTTTDGTQLETAGEQRDAISALIEAYEYAVRRFGELAPVDVVVVESNHDRYSVFWLGKVLEALFRRAPHVRVDAARGPRKYYQYGATLLGLEHGDKVRPRDLAALMASEAPALWSATRYREWLRGHVHHSAGMYYPLASDAGVTVRVIPALCPPDEYHVLHGYVGSHRAAEVLYYHREHGPAGSFPVFVDEVAPRMDVYGRAESERHD